MHSHMLGTIVSSHPDPEPGAIMRPESAILKTCHFFELRWMLQKQYSEAISDYTEAIRLNSNGKRHA
jgi:hypothetical protein